MCTTLTSRRFRPLLIGALALFAAACSGGSEGGGEDDPGADISIDTGETTGGDGTSDATPDEGPGDAGPDAELPPDGADTSDAADTADAADTDVEDTCGASSECELMFAMPGALCVDGACVACGEAAECAADPDYGALYACEGGACTKQAADCISTKGCNGEPGFEGTLCVDGTCQACTSADECQADAVYAGENTDCIEGRCDLCPAGRIGCACDVGETCSEGFCVEGVCDACPEGWLGCPCGPEGSCEQGVCIADSCVDCTIGEIGCVCDADDMCAAGGRCDSDGVLCEECPAGEEGCPCGAEGSCGEGLECVAELCAVDVCDPGEEGCPCGEAGFCEPGLGCQMDGNCAVCEADALGCDCDPELGCTGGLICDPADETCREKVTCEDLQCGEGVVCEAGDVGFDSACLDECVEGYEWNGDTGACDLIIIANCGEAPGTIAAECSGEYRRCVEGAAEPATEITANLVAHLPFDGSADDVSETGLTMNVAGNPVYVDDRDGNPESALAFDGTLDEVWSEANPALEMTDGISILFWMNVDNTNNWRAILNYGKDRNSDPSWAAYAWDTGAWRFWIRRADGSLLADIQPAIEEAEPFAGVWRHVAFTWSRADQEARIYENGRLVATEPTDDLPMEYPEGATFRIGRYFDTTFREWKGTLDDVRIYDDRLSEAQIRALLGNEETHCGWCVAGALFDGSDCRPPLTCDDIAATCAEDYRECVDGGTLPTFDATCDICTPPRAEDDGGSCEVSPRADCSDPDVVWIEAEQATKSTGGSGCGGTCWNLFSNGQVYSRIYVPADGDYPLRSMVQPDQAGADRVQAAFRVDGADVQTFEITEPNGTWVEIDHLVALSAGWHEIGVAFLNDINTDGDRNLFVDWFAIEGPGVNLWSLRAPCDAEGRECVDTELTIPECADCVAGYAPNPALDDACDELRSCLDLGCAALGRECDGEPFADCGECLEGLQATDLADPMSRCVEDLTCEDLVCGDDYCVPSDVPGIGASCVPNPCPEGQAETPAGECVVCNGACGPDSGGNTGETGRWWLYTLADGTCFCENEEGWYTPSSGAQLPVKCDVDGDGWVSSDAKLTIEDDDPVRRHNARCYPRTVDRIRLRNEIGQQIEVLLCGADGPLPLGVGWGDSCPSGAPEPITLFEDVELDDVTKRPADDTSFPTYANGLASRDLTTRELNPLTKACVTDRGDFNHNGIVDVSEAAGMTPPAEVSLTALEATLLDFGVFAELHRTWYEDRPGEDHGALVIAERSRCELGGAGGPTFPLGYTEQSGSSYWRQCDRSRGEGFSASAGVPGWDLAQFSCAETSGGCIFPPPSTVADPTTAPPVTGQCDNAASCGAACAFDPEPVTEDLSGFEWLLYGDATRPGDGTVDLGPAVGGTHGAVYDGVQPITTHNARISFDFATNDDAGGMALTLYDAAAGDPTPFVTGAIGEGAGNGYQLPPGTVQALTVEIDVWDGHTGDPWSTGVQGEGDHFAIHVDADSETTGGRWADAAAFTDGAWHRMEVQIWGTWVEVRVDGGIVLAHRVPELDFDQAYIALAGAYATYTADIIRKVRNLDVDEGFWRGMNHASQFRCTQAVDGAPAQPWQTSFDVLYDSASGKDGAWQFNDCGASGTEANATPIANPDQPAIACSQALPDNGAVGFIARRYDDAKGEGAYEGGCIDEWLSWPELCPGYVADPSGGAQGTIGDGLFNQFGRLVCGCGVDYGGLDCEIGCASPAYGDADGGAMVPQDYGVAPRSGYWLCGEVTSSHMESYDPSAGPVFAGPDAGAGESWTVEGKLRIAPRERNPLCENPGACGFGWSLR